MSKNTGLSSTTPFPLDGSSFPHRQRPRFLLTHNIVRNFYRVTIAPPHRPLSLSPSYLLYDDCTYDALYCILGLSPLSSLSCIPLKCLFYVFFVVLLSLTFTSPLTLPFLPFRVFSQVTLLSFSVPLRQSSPFHDLPLSCVPYPLSL